MAADDKKPVVIKGGPTQPSRDTVTYDDLGTKKDGVVVGGRGVDKPLDAMTAEERAALVVAADEKTANLNASTDLKDSVGKLKGSFAVKQMGHDKHGARIPDEVDYAKPLDAPASHGARGKGMPKDSFRS